MILSDKTEAKKLIETVESNIEKTRKNREWIKQISSKQWLYKRTQVGNVKNNIYNIYSIFGIL